MTSRIMTMRRVLALLGTEVGKAALPCEKCGRAADVKPRIRGDEKVWLWCGHCRAYSPVDLAVIERAEAENAKRVRRGR
jgi:hypothetical protein